MLWLFLCSTFPFAEHLWKQKMGATAVRARGKQAPILQPPPDSPPASPGELSTVPTSKSRYSCKLWIMSLGLMTSFFFSGKIIAVGTKLSKHENPMLLSPVKVKCYRSFHNFRCHFRYPSCLSRTNTNCVSRSKGRIAVMLVKLQNPSQKPMRGASQGFDLLSFESDWISFLCMIHRESSICSVFAAHKSLLLFSSWQSYMAVGSYWAVWKPMIISSIKQLPRNHYANRIKWSTFFYITAAFWLRHDVRNSSVYASSWP